MTFTTSETGDGSWEARCADVPRLRRFVWRWSGGPYIEVADDGGGDAFEVHNVWDYEVDRPVIDRSAEALVGYLDERFAEEAEIDALSDSYGGSLY